MKKIRRNKLYLLIIRSKYRKLNKTLNTQISTTTTTTRITRNEEKKNQGRKEKSKIKKKRIIKEMDYKLTIYNNY